MKAKYIKVLIEVKDGTSICVDIPITLDMTYTEFGNVNLNAKVNTDILENIIDSLKGDITSVALAEN